MKNDQYKKLIDDRYSSQDEDSKYVTLKIADQSFGICVNEVEDILKIKSITSIPLAPSIFLGIVNIRGRIVNVLDISGEFDLPRKINEASSTMNIVTEIEDTLYSLNVDKIGDVINILPSDISPNPDNLSEKWKKVTNGIYHHNDDLIVILDLNKLTKFLLKKYMGDL